MACPNEDTLARLAEGALPVSQAEAAREHLDGCPTCRVLVAELARARSGAPAGESRPQVLLVEGASLGRYVVHERLGAGAMGVVYAAHDPALDRRVALKVLRDDWPEDSSETEATNRLLREGQALARLRSPHVVSVFDVGVHEHRVFVAMELCDGQTLAQWLRQGPRSVAEVLAVLLAAGRGLEDAHRAGLVHRDFKPSNVLVGRDGQVLVTDFGLARWSATPEPSAPKGSPEVSTERLLATRSGALVGTPAYMSPEQLLGRTADERSDQFSFCVTAYEALAGTRPFHGDTAAELDAAVRTGASAKPLVQKAVPRSVRQALLRGLTHDPAHRFATMGELLRLLEAARGRRGRRLAALLVTAGVAGVAGVVGFTLLSRPCRDSQRHLAGVWDLPAREAVRQAMLADPKPFASDAWKGVEAGLDARAAEWAAAHREVCEATRVRKEQSEQVMDLRMGCLRDRLRETRALVQLLREPGGALSERAVRAVHQLPKVARCEEGHVLSPSLRPSPEVQASAAYAQLLEHRATAQALVAAGKFPAASALLEGQLEGARALGHRPLLAELEALLGDALARQRQTALALRWLTDAVLSAEASGHLDAAAQAWNSQVEVLRGQAKFAEAHGAARHAAALSEQLGRPGRLEAAIASNLGLLLEDEGKFSEALEQHQKSLALRRAQGGQEDSTAVSLMHVGNALGAMGDHRAAMEAHREAHERLLRALGPKHPHVAIALKNLGNGDWALNELEPALVRYREALAVQVESLGPEHPEVASTRINVGAVLTQQGDFDGAAQELTAALQLKEKAQGPKHPGLVSVLSNLAVVRQQQKRLAEARSLLERALAISEEAHGPSHPSVEVVLVNLGDVLRLSGDPLGGARRYERAAAITQSVHGEAHPNLGEDLGGWGLCLLDAGQPNAARPLLERAVRILEAAQADPVNLSKVRFALARALWSSGGNRQASLKLAHDARAVLATSGGRQESDVKEVDTWLSTRSGAR